jgi:cellobiose-specific phosphotransferase system component IIA
MLTSRIILYLLIILLIISYYCEAQQEIRKAIKAKKNRKVKAANKKIKQANQAIEHVKDEAKAPFVQAGAKINQKYENTRRKGHAIKEVIKS